MQLNKEMAAKKISPERSAEKLIYGKTTRKQIYDSGSCKNDKEYPGYTAEFSSNKRKKAPFLFYSNLWRVAGTKTAAVKSMPPIQKIAERMCV